MATDPLQKEIERYRLTQDELTNSYALAEEVGLSYQRGLRQFESSFLAAVDQEQQCLHRWEQRCTILDEIIHRLETQEWTQSPPPALMGDWVQAAEAPFVGENRTSLPEEPVPVFLGEEEEREAKHLYRELARRFHPDLVVGEPLQEARRDVMAQINEAYECNDIDALRELKHHPDIRDAEAESQGEQWERLVREIALLEQRIEQRHADTAALQESDLGQLMEQLGSDGSPARFTPVLETLRQRTVYSQERWRQLRQREAQLWLELDDG